MRPGRPAVAALCAAVASLALLTGCGGTSSGRDTQRVGSAGGSDHRLTDRSNGTTLHARVGDTITVVLHSTYWQLADPGGGELVAATAPSAAPGGDGCPTIPGTGCGTLTAAYRVASTGSTHIDAERESCGEAMRCTGDQGRWSVTVVATR
jgi:hypothetical protein